MQFSKILLIILFSIPFTTYGNQTIIFDHLANRISQLNLINVSNKYFYFVLNTSY
jgi:hypothetical protein